MSTSAREQPAPTEPAPALTTAEREHLKTASDALHQFAQLRTAGTVPESLRRAHEAIRAALSQDRPRNPAP